MIHKLPIFPLNTVLFPGAPITLHIFEERYRLMIGRCLEQNSPFGVVLIRSGSEVMPDDPWVRRQREILGLSPAESGQTRETIPHAVGTTAQIRNGESVRLDDGRYYLAAVGQRRFRIQYLAQRQPYMVASVSFLPEESAQADVAQAIQLRALYTRYWAALCAATGHQHEAEALPDDVIDLTYWMAHRLRVDSHHKQRWLEADVATRLREMSAALRAELALLPASGSDERERGWSGSGSWN
jgi:Lon protease-like protein